MGKFVGMKHIVSGLLLIAGLAVLLIAQTAFATPSVGVEGTSLAVGTFDDLEARSRTDVHEVELRATGPTDVHIDTHVVRNEGDVEAVVYVTSIVPQGAGRRIDALDPGTRGF